MSAQVLVVDGLRKSFGELAALDGLAFTARAGEIVAMLGPNGAGKTTALRCIAGILLPDSGSITIAGAPAGSRQAQASVSFMPESPDLYPGLTVAEHLRFIALAYRLKEWRDRAGALLDRFHMADRTDDLPATLSQGMRRKTALIMALLHGARVLLLDEPFNGLDPHAVHELRTLIRDLAGQGVAVVVSTHGLAEAERLTDRILVIDKGRAVALGSLEELRRQAALDHRADLEEVFLSLTAPGDEAAG